MTRLGDSRSRRAGGTYMEPPFFVERAKVGGVGVAGGREVLALLR